jgi:RNA polymerase sigma-70 factor, ECF subfamily
VNGAGHPRQVELEGPARPRQREVDDLTLARAQRGERAAQAQLVKHYARPVCALAGRMMASYPALADDVAQDALVKVLQGLHRFDPSGRARLSTWILTLTTRVCIDALRRQRPSRSLLEEPTGVGDPERAAGQRHLASRVVAAMASLPSDQRAVLVLRAYHDFDYGEIAAALDLEEGTVKSRLARAREALRRSCGLEAENKVVP